MSVWKDENKQKEAGEGPYLRNLVLSAIIYGRCLSEKAFNISPNFNCDSQFLGPAPTEFTDHVYELSKSITSYKMCKDLEVDFSKVGISSFTVGEENTDFVVEVNIILVSSP